MRRYRGLIWSILFLYVFGMLPLSGLTEQYTSDWVAPFSRPTIELTAEDAAISFSLEWNGHPLTDGDTVPVGARLNAAVTVAFETDSMQSAAYTLSLPAAVQPDETEWTTLPNGQWSLSGRQIIIEPNGEAAGDLTFAFSFVTTAAGALILPGTAPALTVQDPEYTFAGIGDRIPLASVLESLRISSKPVQMVLTAAEVTYGEDGFLTADTWFDAVVMTVRTDNRETYRITLRNPEPEPPAPLLFEGRDYTVRVWPSDTANLPANAVLQVEEQAQTEAYAALAAGRLEISEEEICFLRAFDLSVLADGKPFEPEGPVRVAISLKTEGDRVVAMHFVNDGGMEKMRGAKKSAPPAASAADLLETEVTDEGVSFLTGHFSIYAVVGYTLTQTVETGDGKTYEIRMTFMEDAELPDDVALDVRELTEDEREDYLGRTAVLMNAAGFAYSRVFDISLVDGEGGEVQPNAAVRISVTLLDAENTEDAFTVVHFGDDEPEQLSSESDGNCVRFSTDGFSAYAIVQGPAAVPLGWSTIATLDELKAFSEQGEGFYIGHTAGYYLMDKLDDSNNRIGIKKTQPAASSPGPDAAMYYFEPVEGTDNKFYIRCENVGYVKNAYNNSLSFTDNAGKTAFTVTVASDGVVRINNGAWYWNMQGGTSGKRICAYNAAVDPNNTFYIWRYEETVDDPYGLDGSSFGLMNWNGGIAGKAMMAETSGSTLTANPLIVMTKNNDNTDKLFVPKDSDISMWSFEWVERDIYYLHCDGGYLQLNSSGISLVSEPTDACKLQVIPGSGTHSGEICLKSGNTTLTYNMPAGSGSSEEQIGSFGIGGTTGSEWLHLVNLSELTSDYFMVYSASKVGVSDERVQDGSRIIVYCRIWNEDTKAYEFYAVDHDGTLKRCYERGDDIQWVGGQLNTMLWNLVEYTDEQTGEPNGYYELYNQYSGRYMAPQLTGGQVLSGNTIGVNMNGRTNGAYQTTVVAWDDPHYAYTCVKADVEQGKIISIPYVEASQTPDAVDFLFAIVNELPVSDQLHTVPTVDHQQNGITVKIQDFGTRTQMSDFLGNNEGGAVTTLVQGLLSSSLDASGYPTATATGNSLSSWFGSAQEVNHLFIKSTYNSSGYYEYDSTQNFASLHGNNFVVYRELASYDSAGGRNTLKHGQFFPLNDIEPGVFASVNGENLYSATARSLPDSDPRKHEQLYLIKNVNTYFGMEIEASFVQTPNGLDAWGHDIIYEFTGDDDFWLYVDGELLIDLGGIHSAVPGSVNYRTGEVNVNGTRTTIRDLFYKNYIGRGMTPADAQALIDEKFQQNDAGQWIFKDNTNHTMKIFYLERGAGASNLHMRFNLASVRPGTVELSKELEGVDAGESVLAEFAYQIKYTIDGQHGETIEGHLVQDTQQPNVVYKDTTTPVTFMNSITIDGIRYDNVFILKPGEKAVIDLNDRIIAGGGNDIRYEIVECGINPAVYSDVSIDANGVSAPVVTDRGNGRKDYATGYGTTKNRPTVIYHNQVDPSALRRLTFTKKLYREDGETEITYAEDQTPFTFRLYLGTESEANPSPARMHIYHVLDAAGDYCVWNEPQQRFESLHKSDYSTLTPAEKTAARFSTSPNGSISKIPATYTVEVREMLAGTKYRVEERPWEIPDGYSFQKYNMDATAQLVDRSGAAGVQDVIVADQDAHADICNLRGYGLRVNKVWTDAEFMSDREPTYFAVFMDDGNGGLTLVPREDSVKRMTYGDRPQTRYWYYLTLPVADVPFSRYVIYEVTLSNPDPTVDADGIVTDYGTVTPIGEAQEVQLTGTQKGETAAGDFTYAVHYDRNEPDPDSNVRVDVVTNSRPGIILRKTDWDGQPLADAVFTLEDADDNLIGTFTSDETGFLTNIFLREGVAYTLTETDVPTGYCGLDLPIQLLLTESGAQATGADSDLYDLSTDPGTNVTTLTVRNRTSSLTIIKVDGSTSAPLSGIHFSLHRQITVDDVTAFDITPLPGNEDIVTDVDGLLRIKDADGLLWEDVIQALPPGTYQLKEKQPIPEIYKHLPEDVQFTIRPNGTVSVINLRYQEWLQSTTADGHTTWLLSIRNDPYDPVDLTITGTKIMKGRELNANEFRFLLTPIDISGTPIGEPMTAMNTAAAEGEEAQFSFNLTYHASDYLNAQYLDAEETAWFYYDVSEAISEAADENGYDDHTRIWYDTNHFLVVVRVWVENQELKLQRTICPYDGGDVPAKYQPPMRSVQAKLSTQNH